MTLRVTRQYVEALSSGSGYLRLTRQCVEVLSDASAGGTAYERAATDTLGLSDTAVRAGAVFERPVADALSLTDTTTDEAIHLVSDEVNLSDAAVIASVERHRGVIDSLAFADTTDEIGPVNGATGHAISFNQTATGRVSAINVSISDTLAFEQQQGRTFYATASSTLSLGIVGLKCNAAKDTLTLTQTVSAGKSKLATSIIALTETVGLVAIYSRTVTNDLALVHSGTYQLVGPVGIPRQYRPFVGFSSDATITPPTVTVPTLADATLTLTYPYAAPTLTVVLRNPEFSNKDSLNFNRINRATRGGSLIVFADPIWPKTQTLQVEVRGLNEQQVAYLKEFLAASLGKEIGLLDHENRQWRGIITDPDTAISTPARDDNTVSFTFEGEPAS